MVEHDHVEFQGRVRQADNANRSADHITHVTGIIASAGINPLAQGTAYSSFVDAYSVLEPNGFALEKIIDAIDEGLPISNHSYGSAAGWLFDPAFPYNWRWLGDTTLSSQDDFQFGFYNEWAQFHDALNFYYPYHVYITSAGNSRNIPGPQNPPFNHEIFVPGQGWKKSTVQRKANGPYDTTPFTAVAKNIITVGSVNSLGPNDFPMADDSSWGPTDDGRIKPDLVGVGVDVLSTLNHGSINKNRYATFSGTSMSAPNVAGGIALIRQHFIQTHFYFPLASTLKALAIHTAQQSPSKPPGPNYQFGWGILDVEKATNLISKLDSQKVIMHEFIIESGEKYTRKINSDGKQPLEVSIAWNDPEAEIPFSFLNPRDTVLVNDLDLKLIGPDGTEHFPWVLDFLEPDKAATKGINWLDNVEKVVVENPIAGEYTIEISHKKQKLEYDFQIVSLIGHGISLASDFKTLYWIGGSGNWNNPTKWSESSGGTPAGRVPNSKDIIRFDNNSFQSDENVLSISPNAECLHLIFSSDKKVSFEFAGHSLKVDGSLILNKKTEFLGNGNIIMPAGNVNYNGIKTSGTKLSGISITLSNVDAVWELDDSLHVKNLIIEKGIIDFSGQKLRAENVVIGGKNSEVGVLMDGVEISGLQTFISYTDDLFIFSAEGSSLQFVGLGQNDTLVLNTKELAFEKIQFKNGIGNILNLAAAGDIIAERGLILNHDLDARKLKVNPGAQILWTSATTLRLDEFEGNGNTENRLKFSGKANEPATLFIRAFEKFCLDYTDVNNVKAEGNATLNAGPNGSLLGITNGWTALNCNDVLFADFQINISCAGIEVDLQDKSDGNPASWEWKIKREGQNDVVLNGKNVKYTFQQSGPYTVQLTVTKDTQSKTIVKTVNVPVNPFADLFIYRDNNNLVASVANAQFQWFLNGEAITGGTARFITPTSPGKYTVRTSNGTCSFMSAEFTLEVVGLRNAHPDGLGIKISPNPFDTEIWFEYNDPHLGILHFEWLDTSGKSINRQSATKTETYFKTQISAPNVRPGVYILRVRTDSRLLNFRLIKR
jgi:PKD repeat protein